MKNYVNCVIFFWVGLSLFYKVSCVMLTQGACPPRTFEDDQRQCYTPRKTSVHRPSWTYHRGTFLLDCEQINWAEGENLPSWSTKQQVFLLKTYPWVRFYQFSMKEATFCQKTDNFAYFFTPILPAWIQKAIVSSVYRTKGLFVLHQ